MLAVARTRISCRERVAVPTPGWVADGRRGRPPSRSPRVHTSGADPLVALPAGATADTQCMQTSGAFCFPAFSFPRANPAPDVPHHIVDMM